MSVGEDVKIADIAEKPITQTAVLQWIIPGIMSVILGALAWGVNKMDNNFQRIDAYMAKTDASYSVMHNDLERQKAEIPVLRQQIQDVRDVSRQNAWKIDEIAAAQAPHQK